jgi:hypothetical protein
LEGEFNQFGPVVDAETRCQACDICRRGHRWGQVFTFDIDIFPDSGI